jgi:excisionase family DNA binding protein
VKLGRRGTSVDGQSPPERRGFSVAEVAEMFGACEMTVRRAIKTGELRAFRLRGRIVIPADALDAMATSGPSPEHTVGGSAPEGGAA